MIRRSMKKINIINTQDVNKENSKSNRLDHSGCTKLFSSSDHRSQTLDAMEEKEKEYIHHTIHVNASKYHSKPKKKYYKNKSNLKLDYYMKMNENQNSKRDCSSTIKYKEPILDTSYITGSLDVFHKYSNYLNNLWSKHTRKGSVASQKVSPRSINKLKNKGDNIWVLSKIFKESSLSDFERIKMKRVGSKSKDEWDQDKQLHMTMKKNSFDFGGSTFECKTSDTTQPLANEMNKTYHKNSISDYK